MSVKVVPDSTSTIKAEQLNAVAVLQTAFWNCDWVRDAVWAAPVIN
jgi:hypothetical protein